MATLKKTEIDFLDQLYRFMQVKSIVECSPFDLHKATICHLSGRITQVLLYHKIVTAAVMSGTLKGKQEKK